MSYLSVPRLMFSGRFQADPSTINNDPEHFDTHEFRSSYQLRGEGAANGWWNPRGSGAWRFRDCAVTQVVYGDGTVCDDQNFDPIVGTPVNDVDGRVSGKLVDLDPEQQMVSQIWGFGVHVGASRSGVGFRGDFVPAAFTDIWTRFPQGRPDSFFGAFYQSILDGLVWHGSGTSRFLAELAASGTPERLSIRFTVDGYDDDVTSQGFTFGRVTGVIGRYLDGEPHHFVAGRALAAVPQSPLNAAYAQVDGDVLTLDMGNSLPTQSVGGPLVDLGRLYLALVPADGAPVPVADIDYRAAGWYEQTGGVVSIRLSDAQAQQIASTPIAVAQWTTPGLQPLLVEAPDGSWLRADDFVFRLDSGASASTTLYATAFGRRVAKQQISLAFDSSQMEGQILQGSVPGPPVGAPLSALSFPTTATTGADGTAAIELTASDPGNPRGYIDGQVYGITYGEGDTPPPVGSVSNPSQILNVLVWDAYDVPERPTWLRDVQPIFQQYADLYPVMRPIVDLANYASVTSRLSTLKSVFSLPMSAPNYMPVTRDLSGPRAEMIRKWLDRPVYMRLESVDDLTAALQQAIELENATVPPYLCALYSIKSGTNTEVADLIRSVVIEEMLHMALVSNILVSIGGRPRIGHAGFVPIYPGPLPGGLRAGLSVRLRRCSIEQIRDVFMSIEEPERTIEQVHRDADSGDPVDVSRYTIGWFYDEIARSLADLSSAGKITFGNADEQVTSWPGTGKLFAVTSLDDARAAIHEIKEQGEGASARNPGDGDRELAHYYKFAEIVAGRRIVTEPGGYAYTGAHVPFDPNGVWPMTDDPSNALLPAGSRALALSEEVGSIYQGLLDGLHRTFNGEPSYLGTAIGSMYSLGVVARQLMELPSGLGDGTTAGPSFELPFPR